MRRHVATAMPGVARRAAVARRRRTRLADAGEVPGRPRRLVWIQSTSFSRRPAARHELAAADLT